MKSNDVSPTCCEILGLIVYLIFRLFIIVCPIVAQIRVIYILCNSDEYINSPDQCKKTISYIELAIGLYIVFFLIFFLGYHLFKFISENFDNEAEPCKMHVAQTIVGLIIFKLYYELFVWGYRLIYNEGRNLFEQTIGSILLTFLTGGLFLIYRYFEITCKYWDDDFHPCARETVRFIAGLGIIYLYVQMWKYGLKWLYESDNYCQRFIGFIFLTIVTVGLFLPVALVQIIYKHWYDYENPCARETVRFIAGVGIIYIYVNMWIIGLKWLYDLNSNPQEKFDLTPIKRFIGFIFLTIVTAGLFLPIALCQVICKYWNDDTNPCARETVRFITGLGIFYLYYQLWHYAIKFYKEQEIGYKIVGIIMIVIASFGIAIPLQIIRFVCVNWDSEITWKKQTARCIGMLGIFYLWYKITTVGHEWVYKTEEQKREVTNTIFGHIFLIIGSFGLYILYKPVELIALNWNSEDACKRQTSRFIGGLGVFYLYYQLLITGHDWVYKQTQSNCKFVTGHFFLLLASLGVFSIYRICELIYEHWNSPNACYKQTARFCGGLGIFYIYIQLWIIGYEWVYRQKEDNLKYVIGHIFLTIASLGFFIPIRIVQLIVFNWDNPDPCYRQIARCFGGLIIFYFIYRSIQYSYKWVYTDPTSFLSVIGFITLTIYTLGIIIFVEVAKDGCKNVYRQQSISLQFFGHLQLTVVTLGLFIPVRIFQFICDNWNSSVDWKYHACRLIVFLVVPYIWFVLFVYSYQNAYRKQQIQKNISGRIGLTFLTAGLYIIIMMIQYTMYTHNLLNYHHFASNQYKRGVVLFSFPTLGLYGIFHLTRQSYIWYRYLGNLILIGINVAGAYFACIAIIQTYAIQYKYQILIICAFAIFSYPCYRFMTEFVIYNPIVRYMFEMIKNGLIFFGRGFSFLLARISYPIYLLGIAVGNGSKIAGCWIQTSFSSSYAYFTNKRWIWQGYYYSRQPITPEQPEYYHPIVYAPELIQADPFKTWDQRQAERMSSVEFRLNQHQRSHYDVLSCIIGNIKHTYNHCVDRFSFSQVILWVDRYAKLDKEEENVKLYYEALIKTDLNVPDNFILVDIDVEMLQKTRELVMENTNLEFFDNLKGIIATNIFEVQQQ